MSVKASVPALALALVSLKAQPWMSVKALVSL
jgi:hypothetical protein